MGKSIGNYSLIEDQKFALEQIIDIIKNNNIDAVMIAGDIYDTAVASSEAMDLYSNFIETIIFELKKPVLAISGNHDSSRRLDVHNRFFTANNYYLHGEYRGKAASGLDNGDVITLEDDYGKIHFHLIPFMTINAAKLIFDDEINNFTDVYRNLLTDKSYEDRNILITHCYANTRTEEDEDTYTEGQKPLVIGGTDAMDGHLFLDFDYVALGHLHRKHHVIDPKIRYAGTFMKYSFDANEGEKSVTIVDITDEVRTEEIKINPLRDFRILTGTLDEINTKNEASDDYIKFVLTDDTTITNAMTKLKEKFPHAVQVTYANNAIFNIDNELTLDLENKNTLELFEEFYRYKMDEDMTVEQIEALREVLE